MLNLSVQVGHRPRPQHSDHPRPDRPDTLTNCPDKQQSGGATPQYSAKGFNYTLRGRTGLKRPGQGLSDGEKSR